MARPNLQLVGEGTRPLAPVVEPTVRMTLRRLFPLLVYAHRHDSAWLRDFADDEIVVTEDLAEVIGEFDRIVHRQKRA